MIPGAPPAGKQRPCPREQCGAARSATVGRLRSRGAPDARVRGTRRGVRHRNRCTDARGVYRAARKRVRRGSPPWRAGERLRESPAGSRGSAGTVGRPAAARAARAAAGRKPPRDLRAPGCRYPALRGPWHAHRRVLFASRRLEKALPKATVALAAPLTTGTASATVRTAATEWPYSSEYLTPMLCRNLRSSTVSTVGLADDFCVFGDASVRHSRQQSERGFTIRTSL